MLPYTKSKGFQIQTSLSAWDPSLFKASCGFRVYLAVAKKDEVYIQAFHWLFQGLIPAFFEKNHEIIMLNF